MEERYGEIYYVTDDERTSIERGLTAIFWVSESPARHLELRQRGARLADAPASGSPSSVCGRGDRLNALTLRRCRWIARTMAESSTITTLRTKRDQIEGLIAHLEDRIKEARTDLAHVNATLRLFEMDGGARESVRSYMDLNRMFPRGELRKLCLEALEATQAPMSTREISAYVMTVKGWDEDDKALRRSVTFRIVNTLRVPRRQDRIERVKKQKG